MNSVAGNPEVLRLKAPELLLKRESAQKITLIAMAILLTVVVFTSAHACTPFIAVVISISSLLLSWTSYASGILVVTKQSLKKGEVEVVEQSEPEIEIEFSEQEVLE